MSNQYFNHPLIQYYIHFNNFGRLMGMDFKILDNGDVEYYIEITKDHLATPVAAHGGVVAALLDACLGVCALAEVVESERVVSTVDLKYSFLAPVLLGDKLIAKSKIVKAGKKLIFVEGVLLNQNAEKIAIATGTFNAYPASKIGYASGKLASK